MRRVIEFLKWQAGWWRSRGFGHVFARELESEGFVAYAERQTRLRFAMLDHFEQLWSDVPFLVSLQLESETHDDVSPSIEGPPVVEED
jgi:hypothetical protein